MHHKVLHPHILKRRHKLNITMLDHINRINGNSRINFHNKDNGSSPQDMISLATNILKVKTTMDSPILCSTRTNNHTSSSRRKVLAHQRESVRHVSEFSHVAVVLTSSSERWRSWASIQQQDLLTRDMKGVVLVTSGCVNIEHVLGFNGRYWTNWISLSKSYLALLLFGLFLLPFAFIYCSQGPTLHLGTRSLHGKTRVRCRKSLSSSIISLHKVSLHDP